MNDHSNINTNNYPERDMMPYERFLRYGGSALSNEELIAIILRKGVKGNHVMDQARQILRIRDRNNTGLSVLYSLTLKDLKSIRGIGQVGAVKLLCLTEIARRMAREERTKRPVFREASAFADYYMEDLRHEAAEQVWLVMLNSKMELISEQIVSTGTATCSLVSPREIFQRASAVGALSIVLMHNHPSGDPSPSGEDIEVTRRIASLGEMLEIHLVDHIIFGDRKYCRLREAGYLS